jgi:hypothetical protein
MFDLLHENALADHALLRTNDREGDIFDTPRDVDFAFKTNEISRAEDFCEFVNGKNFGRAHIRATEGEELIWISVDIHMPINQNLIGSVSGFMVCLSRLFQIEYDGWGSVIQGKTSPAIQEQP